MPRKINIKIPRSPGRIDKFLADESGLTRSRIQKLMKEGHVVVTDTLAVITIPDPVATSLEPDHRDIEILFEDEHLAVINKPQGISVHPSDAEPTGTLVHVLLAKLGKLSGIGGVLRPGIVHRLDKQTSGALVVSKTDDVHVKLNEDFSKHAIERVYWALCYGGPTTEESFRISGTIGRNPKDRKKMAAGVRGGRNAATDARLIEAYGKGKWPFASWMEARLETGRTHQVRVHLTSKSWSLLGDPIYGVPTERQSKWLELPKNIREIIERLPGQALHARVLGFTHPVTGKKMRFEAEPPVIWTELQDALQEWRL